MAQAERPTALKGKQFSSRLMSQAASFSTRPRSEADLSFRRCRLIHDSQLFAVKAILTPDGSSIRPSEVEALELANQFDIAGVVKFQEVLHGRDGHSYIVQE